MATVSVRYIVAGFAMLSHGALRLLLSTPGGGGGAGQTMPDGRKPEPGGWNRIQLGNPIELFEPARRGPR